MFHIFLLLIFLYCFFFCYLCFSFLLLVLVLTIELVSVAGRFQGMLLLLPFFPFIFIISILQAPNSTVGKAVSYIPFTSPFVMIFRLTLMKDWIWWEIALSVTILCLSIWICTKLAGKIFKIGIQKYGKNATPKEIWKWMWSS